MLITQPLSFSFIYLRPLTICQNWPARPVRHKWNTRVLRTERTGSGQTGPAHEVGPLNSLGPVRNVRSERPNS